METDKIILISLIGLNISLLLIIIANILQYNYIKEMEKIPFVSSKVPPPNVVEVMIFTPSHIEDNSTMINQVNGDKNG